MDILSGFLWHLWISNINGICSDFIILSHLLEVCWLQKVLEPASDLWDRSGVECNKFRIRNCDEVVMRGCDLTCVEELERKQVQINHHFDYYQLWLSNLCHVTVSQLSCNVWKECPVLPSFLNKIKEKLPLFIALSNYLPPYIFDLILSLLIISTWNMPSKYKNSIPFHFCFCKATCQSHYFIRLVKWFLGKLIAAAAERIISETRTPGLITELGVQDVH